MWIIWNKETEINGFSAEAFLERNKHLAKEDVIYLKTVGERVTQVEGKSILATVYGIDATLGDEEFIAAYEAAINPPADPEELTDSEALSIITGGTEV